MRQKDANFIVMCKSVQTVLQKNAMMGQTIPAFSKLVLAFDKLMREVNASATNAEIITTGTTDDKSELELKVVTLAVNLAKRASVYALENNNMSLHDQLRVSKTTMLRRPDVLTLSKLRDIQQRVLAIVAQLSDYGVTQVDVDQLNTLIVEFENQVSSPRDKIVERKGHNQEVIPSLLADIREILYKMDSLMNLFKDQPFGIDYKNARMIIDLGSRKEEEQNPLL